jgi:hypothetical protein
VTSGANVDSGLFETSLRDERFLPFEGAGVEPFNLFNRDNQRYSLSDDGFLNSAGQFVPLDRNARGRLYPAYYQQPTSFLKASSAYAPRLIQLGLRFVF